MSLTTQLKAAGSPLRAFFAERLPRTRSWITTINGELRRSPLATSHPDDPGLSGMAIDYRIRYHFGITPKEQLVGYKGARRLHLVAPRALPHMQILGPLFFDALTATLDRIKPVGRQLDSADDELLIRYCVALAQFEQIRRVGSQLRSPFVEAIATGAIATVDDILASASDATVEDVRLMSRDFRERQYPALNRSPMILNPTFAGSADVGGADADIVAGDSLVEFKSTAAERVLAGVDVFQLLGYACLDYGDRYKIRRLGFSLLRRNVLKEWSGGELVSDLSGGAYDYDSFRGEAAAYIQTLKEH